MIGLAGAWGGLLIFDSVIFTLTLYRAIGIWRLGTRRLFQVLIRDGKFVRTPPRTAKLIALTGTIYYLCVIFVL